MRKAAAGDRLVRLVCACKGAVLVAEHAAVDWKCADCKQTGAPTAIVTLAEVIIDGGVPDASVTVKRLAVPDPSEWEAA